MALAKKLGLSRSVYVLDDGAVQSQRSLSFASIADAAKSAGSVVAAILKAHYGSSSGIHSVHLAGWSYGGVVAIEMAKQLGLNAEFRHIKLQSVTLFDSPLRGDVVSESEDHDQVTAIGEEQTDQKVMHASHQHFLACTTLLHTYHKRPTEQQPLTCTVLDVRPMDGTQLSTSSDSVIEWTSGRVDRRVSSGTHWTMLSEENVDQVSLMMNLVYDST
ncbi:MAG: hypothetical protein EOO11_10025 [Chitinophagaceae bacterium]|nr:MAG: hypothetical protein EOO11_10025 [Chitinophagaceae bacterium]